MSFIESLLRGSLGIAVLLAICFALSRNRKAIDWKLVGMGMTMQIVLGILILKVPGVSGVFDWVADKFVTAELFRSWS